MMLSEVAKKIVATAQTKPSKEFGKLAFVVDHRKVGEMAAKFRLKRDIQAVRVAEILGLSRVQIHFMEQGKRRWSLKILNRYITAVNNLSKQKSKETRQ